MLAAVRAGVQRRVLITGGAGFIGRAVARLLEPESHVVIYDIAEPTLDTPHSEYIKGDVMDIETLASAVAGCETVLHLAAQLGVAACQQNEERIRRVNIQGAATLAKAVRCSPTVRTVVALSSSEVYGEGGFCFLHEDDDPRPLSVYAATKLALEATMRELAGSGDRRVVILRPFNVYGPGQRTEFVVARFCVRALTGRPLTLYGSGDQTRTFTYVEDVAAGVVAAAMLDRACSISSGVYNIASRETITIRSLAEFIRMISGSHSDIQIVPFGDPAIERIYEQEVLHRVAHVERASVMLGYSSRVGLAEGLTRTVTWYQEQLKLIQQSGGNVAPTIDNGGYELNTREPPERFDALFSSLSSH